MKKFESRHYVFLGLFVVIFAAMLINVNLDIKISAFAEAFYGFYYNLF